MDTETESREYMPYTAGGSRRRSVRVHAPDDLRGRFTSEAASMAILDISEGGLAALTDRPLALDSPHTLELSLGNAQPLVVRVQVASCLIVERRGGHSVYRTGFRFVGRPRRGTGTIEELLDRLLASAITVC